MNDEDLSACSLEAQGLWLRCICLMYRADTDELTGTLEQMRRKLGVLPEELTRCLHDLKTNNAANVRFGNGDVSIISRRRQKELKAKENNRLYVAKHRAKDECKIDVSTQSKSKSKSIEIREEKEEEKRATTTVISDDQWLDSLQANPAYKPLQVRTEYARAIVWAETNNRQCTRRFFVNWLNRAKPMDTASPKRGQVGKETRTPEQIASLVTDLPCDICGKDVCFSNHYAEVAATYDSPIQTA